MMIVLIKKNTIKLIWRNHRNERVTRVGNQLEQDKVVTWVGSGDLLVSLFLPLFDGTLFDSMF